MTQKTALVVIAFIATHSSLFAADVAHPIANTDRAETASTQIESHTFSVYTPQTEPTYSTALSAQALNRDYTIQYNTTTDFASTSIAGSGQLIYSRTGDTYTATLSAKAMGFSIQEKSIGKIHKDSLATTRFESKRIKPFGPAKTSVVEINYNTQEISNGSDIRPLPYNTVYDFVSAIIYIQGVLQSGTTSDQFTLNIIRGNSIAPMTVQLGSMATAKTDDGDFNAIPVSMNIQSSTISTIKVWFVLEKQYRPLRIEVSLTGGKGKIVLASRNSPD